MSARAGGGRNSSSCSTMRPLLVSAAGCNLQTKRKRFRQSTSSTGSTCARRHQRAKASGAHRSSNAAARALACALCCAPSCSCRVCVASILAIYHSPPHNGRREFLVGNFAELKKGNPDTPILVREASGAEARLIARYGAPRCARPPPPPAALRRRRRSSSSRLHGASDLPCWPWGCCCRLCGAAVRCQLAASTPHGSTRHTAKTTTQHNYRNNNTKHNNRLWRREGGVRAGPRPRRDRQQAAGARQGGRGPAALGRVTRRRERESGSLSLRLPAGGRAREREAQTAADMENRRRRERPAPAAASLSRELGWATVGRRLSPFAAA